jgi:glucokinase
LNPERFIIGGGLSKAGEFLFEQIRVTFKKLSPEPVTRGVLIVPSGLGNDAGMIGAAGLFLRS